jgi:hypothetical protein
MWRQMDKLIRKIQLKCYRVIAESFVSGRCFGDYLAIIILFFRLAAVDFPFLC